MHKYNNQDHAMMTAMLTVRNILAGETAYDVWNVNEDAEYHEAGASSEQEAATRSVSLAVQSIAVICMRCNRQPSRPTRRGVFRRHTRSSAPCPLNNA